MHGDVLFSLFSSVRDVASRCHEAQSRLCPDVCPDVVGQGRDCFFCLRFWKQNLPSFPKLFPIHHLFDLLHSSCAEASPNTVTP